MTVERLIGMMIGTLVGVVVADLLRRFVGWLDRRGNR